MAKSPPTNTRSSNEICLLLSDEELRDSIHAELLRQLNSVCRVLTFTFPIQSVDPLSWLRAQRRTPAFYWSSRDRLREIAGFGNVWSGNDLASAEKYLKAPDDSRLKTLFVGGRFTPTSAHEGLWQNFPNSVCVLPQAAVFRENTDAFLVLNFPIAELSDSGVATRVEHIQRCVHSVTGLVPLSRIQVGVIERTDSPHREDWRECVDKAVELIRSDSLLKVVLARQTTLKVTSAVDPFDFLGDLRQRTSSGYCFLFQPVSNTTFIGCSPERLFALAGEDFVSEAIAGTAPRGMTEDEDKRLAETLFTSRKNRAEHNFVVQAIRGGFDRLCTNYDVDAEPAVIKTAKALHLVTKFRGTVRGGKTASDVFAALHPTPAVGGVPKQKAIDLIHSLEPFDRGWYAGTIGIITANFAELAVAIRSGLIQSDRIILYAGAGIVSGSDPDDEWRELEYKIALPLEALSGQNC